MDIALYGSIAWKHPFGFGQVIDWASEFGWDAVDARGMSLDLPGEDARRVLAFGYDMLGPRQIRKSARSDLRRRLDEAGVPLLGIYCSSPVNLAGRLGESCRELFCEFIELAADLNAEWIRAINNTTGSYTDQPFGPDEAFDRTVRGLREVGRHAAEHGVGIMLENNENTTTSTAEELAEMASAVDGVCPIGIAWDGANAYFQQTDPAEGLDRLRDRITVLHLKNVRRHDSDEHGYMPRGEFSYEWTGLADGDLDWSELLSQAQAVGFDGPLIFEYVNPFKGMPADYWNVLREPAEAARVEAEYLRGIIEGLRRG